MSLYSIIVIGVLALVSLAAFIGAARDVEDDQCEHWHPEKRPCSANEGAELALTMRPPAIERAWDAAERAGQCLPPRPRRCPWCGCPIPSTH